MKKLTLLFALVIGASAVNAQQGSLHPDSSAVVKDTTHGTFVYLDEQDKLQVVQGYVVRTLAPMVFVGTDGKKAKTDQVGLLSEKAYANKKELESVIYFKPKKQSK
jgi:hypothetical protein